ncbi:hypothetical protein ACRAWG_20145 [Methylobacterium sp. P31]
MTNLHPTAVYVLKTPGWKIRVWLAIVLTLVLASLPVPVAGLTLWVLALPYLMMAETLARMVGEGDRARRLLEADHEGQAAQLAGRDARIKRLEGELAEVRAAAHRAANTVGNPVYRRVGLSPSAPDWLVEAARRAYRRRLHPDVHPPHHRPQAHDRYIRAEEAFERIRQLRA